MKRLSTGDFYGTGPALYTIMVLQVIVHLPKPIECTPPRVNLNVNHGLWVIVMCQCGFISFNKCTTLRQEVNNWGGYAYGRIRGI